MKTKIIWIIVLLAPVFFWSVASAVQTEFELIPNVEDSDRTSDVNKLSDPGQAWDNFAEIYNQQAKWFGDKDKQWSIKECSGLWAQLASGIMNRDTILCIAAQVVRFVTNMAMVVWAGMIIYAGYMYATAVFNGWNAAKWWEAIKRAIVGIVVIIFSYAILNLLINAFL